MNVSQNIYLKNVSENKVDFTDFFIEFNFCIYN